MTTTAWRAFPAPGLITQIDGSAFQWENCAPSMWAGLVVSQQQGRRPAKGSPWYPSGASLRTASGDRSGGITPSLLDTTVRRVYDIDLEVRIASVALVQARLDAGFALGELLQYGPIADAGWSGSPGFRGAHSDGLYGTRTRPDGVIEWLVGDPLYNGRRAGIPKGMQWIPRSVVIRAGQALVLDSTGHTMRQRYGAGMLYVVLTTVPYQGSAPPIASPQIVTSAPVTAADKGNRMLTSAWTVSSGKVQRLAQDQALYSHPGGPRVTRMSRTATVQLIGRTGAWNGVLVRTGVPYRDKQSRPTVLYVPAAAGPVTDR